MGFGFYQTDDEEHRRLRELTKWMADIAVVLVFALFLVLFLGQRSTIAGHSMRETLEDGDVVLINELCYNFSNPGRFDIVLFENGDKRSVKRVVGLPGETVQIIDGQIYIDGSLLPMDEDRGRIGIPGLAAQPIVLGRDEYFLLGDNYDSSEDSRFENVGNVYRSQIVGKVWFRISPGDKIGWIR